MTHLLDINVLLALAWPNHVHHSAARAWFATAHRSGWATCAVTEAGFIRVSSNRRATEDARSPGEAALLLDRMCALAGHEFLVDGVRLARRHAELGSAAHASSHVTDVHLILLAGDAGVALATFDRQAAHTARQLGVAAELLAM